MNLYSSNLGKSFARKHIIAQLLCPVQRSLMQGFQISGVLHYHYDCNKTFGNCKDEEQFFLGNGSRYGIPLPKSSGIPPARKGCFSTPLKCFWMTDHSPFAFSKLTARPRVGVPVHLVPEGTAGAEVIAVKKVNETGFYSLSHHQFAEQVGLSQPKATAVIRYLKIKDDGDCFRCFQFGKTKINRYSSKAVEKIKAALPQLDMAAVWKAYTNGGRAA
jgi:hypothetical protein